MCFISSRSHSFDGGCVRRVRQHQVEPTPESEAETGLGHVAQCRRINDVSHLRIHVRPPRAKDMIIGITHGS